MAEETKDIKQETGDVAQTTGIDAAAGVQQDVTSDAAGNQDEVAGLKAAAAEERKKRQDIEAQLKLQQDQMLLMNANAPQTQIQQPKSEYEQAIIDLGYDPEYLTEPERGNVFARMTQNMNVRNSQNAQAQANQQFINANPDYNEAVGRQVGNQFIPSAEITEILQRKPHLTAAAYASSEGAYRIVTDERALKELQQKTAVNDEHLSQNEIDNKTSVVSGAAAAGGAIPGNAGKVNVQQQQDMEQRVADGEFNS